MMVCSFAPRSASCVPTVCLLCPEGNRRHTHGSHALNGRPGEKGVPIQVVQNNLGHASIGTTSGYLTTERDARLAAMKGFGQRAKDR
jgi:hypothetical protein